MSTTTQSARATLHLQKYQIAAILAAARVIQPAILAELARFPAPVPTMAVLLTQTTALDLAEQAIARSPRGTATPARNTARDILWTSLQSLKRYVQTVAEADAVNSIAIIKSAGFDVALTGVHIKALLLAVVTGFAGGVKLVANAGALTGSSRKRGTYNWQYSLDGGHTWVTVPGTSAARTTINGLPVLTNVSFRVSVTLKSVMQPWSQMVTIPVH